MTGSAQEGVDPEEHHHLQPPGHIQKVVGVAEGLEVRLIKDHLTPALLLPHLVNT